MKTVVNVSRLAELGPVVERFLTEVLQRGYHGGAEIQIKVQDRTIQHVVLKTEKVVR
jgi:hypothetical protein